MIDRQVNKWIQSDIIKLQKDFNLGPNLSKLWTKLSNKRIVCNPLFYTLVDRIQVKTTISMVTDVLNIICL